jgi:diguanylate cyclase (GGDEF)-like protein/PAS domain S-box-containing protein
MMKKRSGKQEKNKNHFWEKYSRKIYHIGNSTDPVKGSSRIAGIYIVMGSLWILLSDKMLAMLVDDREVMTLISMIKGWIYVFASGGIVFALVYTALGRIYHEHQEQVASEEALRQQYASLVESQKQLSRSEERYRLILEATNDGIWDEQEEKRYFSDRWLELTGYTREDLNEMGDWKSLIHPEDRTGAIASMEEYREKRIPHYRYTYRLKRKDGQYIWIQARGKALFDGDGNVYRMAGSHTDITELKEYQEQLHYMAYHDTLTELPNRLALYEDLSGIFANSTDTRGALFFIDLDNFKFVNDSMGQSFGDRLIRIVGYRLTQILNEAGTVYRFGGDEFVVYINGYRDTEELAGYALMILNSFKMPLTIGNSIFHATISIGISLYPEHGHDSDELLRCADFALHKAKKTGKNRYILFDQTMSETFSEWMVIEKHLRMALEKNEFQIHYQPQLDLESGRISGFEALLRWQNPELGEVPPIKFIKIAEDTHIIIEVGKWVLQNACLFIKTLHRNGYPGLSVSVNISILQLLQEDFVEGVLETLLQLEFEPEHLELEITESILMESYEIIGMKLRQMQRCGVRIALDDFGKGYSSLHYLLQLPINTLKVDKSFIDSITSGEQESALAGQIISIGKSLGLCVIAEGVEVQEQMDYLIKQGCHKIQGYYFSKPLPEKDVKRILA